MHRAARRRRRRRDRVISTPCTISSGSLPARRASIDPATRRRSTRPDRDRKRRAPGRAALRPAAERRDVRLAVRRRRLTGKPRSRRAADVRRVDRRDPELRARRLRLLAPRQLIATPSSGRPRPPPSRPRRKSSSSEACAETRNRIALRSRRRDDGSATFASASRQSSGSCAPAALAHQRPPQPIVTFDPVVIEAADVAHPVAVHVRVEARRHADELRALRPFRLRFDPRRRVAALLAQGADRVDGLRVVPRPRLEPVVARGDRADRDRRPSGCPRAASARPSSWNVAISLP